MTATARIVAGLLFPIALLAYVAFQLWVIVEEFPSYARSVWLQWRINTTELRRYVRAVITGEPING